MSNRNNQPAVLRRRIERLEALLAAEKERANKAFQAYGDELAARVVAELKLQRVREAMEGAWE